MTIKSEAGRPCIVCMEVDPSLIPPGFLPDEAVYTGSIRNAVHIRQVEFFLGRQCAALALRQSGSRCLQVFVNEDRSPAWPSGWVGSISHHSTANRIFAVAVVATAKNWKGIGVDCEAVLSLEVLSQVKKDIFTPYEQQYLAATNFQKRQLYATLIFSLKESFYKAVFPTVKRFFDFQAVEVVRIDLVKRSAELVLRETLSAHWRIGHVIQAKYSLLNDKVMTLVTQKVENYAEFDYSRVFSNQPPPITL